MHVKLIKKFGVATEFNIRLVLPSIREQDAEECNVRVIRLSRKDNWLNTVVVKKTSNNATPTEFNKRRTFLHLRRGAKKLRHV